MKGNGKALMKSANDRHESAVRERFETWFREELKKSVEADKKILESLD